MTGNKKNLLVKACTFCMCFFSLFSVGAAALAWFMANREVTSHNKVEPKMDDIKAEYFVYKYSKNNTGTNLDESTEDEEDLLSITNFTLNTYDTIFVAQNKYTPALVRIHIFGKDIPDVESGESKQVSIKIDRFKDFVDQEVIDNLEDGEELNENLYKCISSVADFSVKEATNYSSFIQNNDLNDIMNIESFFDTVVTQFKASTDTPTTFVDPEQNTKKLDTVVLTTTYSNVYKDGDINHIMLYLYIDYDKTLIENFTGTATQNLNANFLSAVDTILVNDLKNIEINFD